MCSEGHLKVISSDSVQVDFSKIYNSCVLKTEQSQHEGYSSMDITNLFPRVETSLSSLY